jgi:hypothetical protein
MATVINGSDNFNTNNVAVPSDLLGNNGETWTGVNRNNGVTYTNTTGKTILIHAGCYTTSSYAQAYVVIDGTIMYTPFIGGNGTNGNYGHHIHFAVPDGSTYEIYTQPSTDHLSVWEFS